MLRSPNNQNALYGSAPNLSGDTDSNPADVNITLRSNKRRRCDCECGNVSQDSKLDTFISTLTAWRQDTDEKLSSIHSSMQDIIKQNTNLLSSNAEIEKSISFLSNKYDDLCIQLESFQKKTKACSERISKVEESTEELDRNSRLSTLEIRNIPLNKNPSQEELINIVMIIFNEISVPVTVSDIFNILRIPSKTENKTIILSLKSVILKNTILKAYRAYNKNHSNRDDKLNTTILGNGFSRHQIYISEHLTPRARRLFYQAREFAKTEDFEHCWTSNGRVLLRKAEGSNPIVVKTEADLANLIQKN